MVVETLTVAGTNTDDTDFDRKQNLNLSRLYSYSSFKDLVPLVTATNYFIYFHYVRTTLGCVLSVSLHGPLQY